LAVGGVGNQIAPALLLWRLSVGDTIDVAYLSQPATSSITDTSSSSDECIIKETRVTLVNNMPQYLDYPWNMVGEFALLSFAPYPFSTSWNTTQINIPQLPVAISGVGGRISQLFHPAL